MNVTRQTFPRLFLAALLLAVFFVSSVGAAPARPQPASWNKGGICNYSSRDLGIVVQQGRDTKDIGWRILKAGGCLKENVVAVIGRQCTGTNCSTQLALLNNSPALVLDSLRPSGSGQALLALVPTSRDARLMPLSQSAWYGFETNKSAFLRTLTYTVEVEKTRFKRPVRSLGEGALKPLGGPAHVNADAYAVDYSAYAGQDKRKAAVYAALAGQVVYSDCTVDYGCAVVVRSYDTSLYGVIYYTVYARLAKDGRPAVGAAVGSGSLLGEVDTSGGLKGSYLHFAVRVSNALYDGTNALYGTAVTYPYNARMFFR